MTDLIIMCVYRDENGKPYKYKGNDEQIYYTETLIEIVKLPIRKVSVILNGNLIQVVPYKDKGKWDLKLKETQTSDNLKLESVLSDCSDSL